MLDNININKVRNGNIFTKIRSQKKDAEKCSIDKHDGGDIKSYRC